MINSAGQKTKRGKKRKLVALFLVIIIGGGGWWVWKEGRPWFHATQAYIYSFPMMMMDLTREAATAVPTAEQFGAPVNQFAVMTEYPDASFRAVVRTGLDTLFAVAWADLDKEPLVLSVPDTGGRYYVIALFDMWTNIFASIGSRTTGTSAGNFLIVGPGWEGKVPPLFKQVVRSPTRFVWINGQMRADGPAEYDVVNPLQKQYRLTPLSRWGRSYTPPAEVPVKTTADTKTAPLERIRNMDAGEYFGRFAQLLKDNPPSPADGPMIDTLKSLGIEPGKDFDISRIDSSSARALQRAMGTFAILEKAVHVMPTKDGWAVMPEDIGDYGTDYINRAGIAFVGLGAVQPIDVSYPVAFNDSEDNPFDGANRYVLHFEKNQIPPTDVTWSVSIYDPDGFYVPNSINRYNLAAWMPLKYNDDSSLDIYIQARSPGADKESNWLPAPATGTFNLVTRIFWPEESVLDGTWQMQGVKKVN
jgi:hypothetical protein